VRPTGCLLSTIDIDDAGEEKREGERILGGIAQADSWRQRQGREARRLSVVQ
jgi:hypothetical protein